MFDLHHRPLIVLDNIAISHTQIHHFNDDARVNARVSLHVVI